MKALTVQQPWAWAIVHGGKDVENRTQAWSYRGPLAIHAGLATDRAGMADPRFTATFEAHFRATTTLDDLAESVSAPLVHGALIGTVDLVDVHVAAALSDDPWSFCCRPWGEPPGVLMKADGKFTGPKTHLVLENPRPLEKPIPAMGRLGLWTPPAEVIDELQAVAR